jgi:toxin ParE1/3/4
MRVEIGPRVEADLEEIAAYIARDNPVRAVSFVRELRGEFGRIGDRPGSYRLRKNLGQGVRMAVKGRYVILFYIHHEVVRIVRVFHGARNLKKLLRERGGLR